MSRTLDEEGDSNIGVAKVVPAGPEGLIRDAVAQCPEKALTIQE